MNVRIAGGVSTKDDDVRSIVLESGVSRLTDIRIVRGGPSKLVFDATLKRMEAISLEKGSDLRYIVDEPKGVFKVWSGKPPADLDQSLFVPEPRPEPGKDLTLFSANDQYSNGALDCTVGFAIKSSFGTGAVSAGHCNDGPLWVNGHSGTTGSQSCAPYDYQVESFSATPVSNSFLDKRAYPHPVISIQAVAGGYLNGQQTLKMGLFQNGATGSNTGTITGQGWTPGPTSGNCAFSADHYGMFITNPGAGGDSGGPIFLRYNNAWYLASITKGFGGPGGTIRTSWVNWIPIGGAQICTSSTPC